MRLRDPRFLLGAAGACAIAFLLLLVMAYGSPRARWLDASALQGFLSLQRPSVDGLVVQLASLGDAMQAGLIGAALAALALARGRPRVAVLVIVLLAATSVSSQLLKALLAYPRVESELIGGTVQAAAFPSGHATAAMSLAIAAVIVSPRRLRPLAAGVGAVLALGVSYSIVALGWHFPSDVAGGFLLATGWALVLLAGLVALDARFPAKAPRERPAVDRGAAVGLAAGAVAAAAAAVTVLLLVVARPFDALDFAARHTAFAVVAAALAATAVALLAALTVTLTRSR